MKPSNKTFLITLLILTTIVVTVTAIEISPMSTKVSFQENPTYHYTTHKNYFDLIEEIEFSKNHASNLKESYKINKTLDKIVSFQDKLSKCKNQDTTCTIELLSLDNFKQIFNNSFHLDAKNNELILTHQKKNYFFNISENFVDLLLDNPKLNETNPDQFIALNCENKNLKFRILNIKNPSNFNSDNLCLIKTRSDYLYNFTYPNFNRIFHFTVNKTSPPRITNIKMKPLENIPYVEISFDLNDTNLESITPRFIDLNTHEKSDRFSTFIEKILVDTIDLNLTPKNSNKLDNALEYFKNPQTTLEATLNKSKIKTLKIYLPIEKLTKNPNYPAIKLELELESFSSENITYSEIFSQRIWNDFYIPVNIKTTINSATFLQSEIPKIDLNGDIEPLILETSTPISSQINFKNSQISLEKDLIFYLNQNGESRQIFTFSDFKSQTNKKTTLPLDLNNIVGQEIRNTCSRLKSQESTSLINYQDYFFSLTTIDSSLLDFPGFNLNKYVENHQSNKVYLTKEKCSKILNPPKSSEN